MRGPEVRALAGAVPSIPIITRSPTLSSGASPSLAGNISVKSPSVKPTLNVLRTGTFLSPCDSSTQTRRIGELAPPNLPTLRC